MSGRTLRAFLDASVIYPVSLRDLLMRLTVSGLFQARWSHRIHEEWIRAVLRNRPDLTREHLIRVRDAMDQNADDAIVVGYEALIPSIDLPDPDDRHVLAAAVTSRCDVIVTFNLRHFPAIAMQPNGIEALHPDEFLSRLLLSAPAAFTESVRRQHASMKKPPVGMDELLAWLERLALPKTVGELRRRLTE